MNNPDDSPDNPCRRPPAHTPPDTAPRHMAPVTTTGPVRWLTVALALAVAAGIGGGDLIPPRWRARIVQGWRRMREEPDAGYSTETVLVTALLVILALAVLAIITVKVTIKARGIDLGLR